ncbi:MAG: hypothetical protein M3O30_07750 [Planctomycetota bacterium]|nr:hypothetical protein [Planctomycetota bacterium]
MDPKQTLSEISHLFLSEMRQRQGNSGGAAGAKPVRIPPGRGQDPRSVDQTGQEASGAEIPADAFAASPSDEQNQSNADMRPVPATTSSTAQISVVLASHLIDQPSEGVRRYARHLAARFGRIGLIEADGAEFGITCLELHGGPGEPPIVIDELDGRRMSETLAELSFDVDRWIVSLPNPRTTEAREVLRLAPHWVLLTTADHDGVVATYRALKGLAELGKPRLSLVVLDAKDEAHADAVFRKLDAVSRQFLDCPMESEIPVRPARDVAENVLLHCRATHDKAQLATAPQWQIVAAFLAAGMAPQSLAAKPIEVDMPQNQQMPEPMANEYTSQSFPRPMQATSPRLAGGEHESFEEVVELPDDASVGSILDAVVRQGGAAGAWVQCPLKAPTCPDAILAVGRDQRLVLLAVAGRGLTELRAIGLALRWMSENRELIRMALPQLAIDASAAPEVRLLVDHADLSAELLQPLLQSGTVRVQAYRRLKWGRKTGLLLEAA